MGNTVGSRGVLTNRQREIIIGTLLGDGHLEKNGRHTRLRIDHYNKQKGYIFWLVNELGPFSLMPREIHEADKRSGKVYSRWHFSTKSLPIFDEFHKMFYIGKRKIIPIRLDEFITPLSLAIWYMDDGFRRKDSKGFYLCTSSYTQEEHIKLQEILYKRFSIFTAIHHQGEYLRTFIPSASADIFNGLIKQYILPNLSYKLL